MNDTAQCHHCNHVFDSSRASGSFVLPTDHAVAEDLDVCLRCGETFRRGLVRCWNCGSFTRPEIEAVYNQQQESHLRHGVRPVLTSDDDSVTLEEPVMPWSGPVARAVDPSDDDFELSDDFELGGGGLLPSRFMESTSDSVAGGVPSLSFATPEAETETYSFQQPTEASTSTESAAAAVTAAASGSVDVSTEAVAAADGATADESSAAKSAGKPARGKSAPVAPEDELLAIAVQEQREVQKLRKELKQRRGQLKPGEFLVYCPKGCRVRVHERFRGRVGRCPKCQSVFFVPVASPDDAAAKTSAGSEAAAAATGSPLSVTAKGLTPAAEVSTVSAGRFNRWLRDAKLHRVVPAKLRLKPGSLESDAVPVDVIWSPESLVVVALVPGAGLFGSAEKKKPAIRDALAKHLEEKGTAEGFKCPIGITLTLSQLKGLSIVQPTPAGSDSLFSEIPVFGVGMIGVKIPKFTEDGLNYYLSFTLSQFREFVPAVRDYLGLTGFASDTEVPIQDEVTAHKCHYSDELVTELHQRAYYEKDPQFNLGVSGWRCESCQLVVSEVARKKEKIGGASGSGLAKAKCPKCKGKFGRNPLFSFATDAASAAASTPAVAASAAPASSPAQSTSAS